MIELMRESQVAGKFKKLVASGTEAVIAVPFWGKGAATLLGLRKGMQLRVVCNLDHPGCNPDAIAEIRKLGIQVKTHPRLHAKIYATSAGAIVGSSNVSSNGLSVEGAAARGWIEANTFCDNAQFVSEVLKLFKEVLWESPDSRRVTAKDLEEARRRRTLLPPQSYSFLKSRTLLAAYREHPANFGSVYVAAYTENLSKVGLAKLRAVRDEAVGETKNSTAGDFKNAQGYEIEGIPEDAWLIDLNCKKLGKERVTGCFRATGLKIETGEDNELTIALRRTVTIGGSILPLAAEEKASLAAVGARLSRKSDTGLIPLADAVRLIDKVAKGEKGKLGGRA